MFDSQFKSQRHAQEWFDNIFCKAVRIVEGDTWEWDDRKKDYVRQYAGREWFKSQRQRFSLHGAVYDMILEHKYRPDMWQQLMLEWPHKAESDPNRLAYTRDERAGEADRQTVTTIGKYLTRHFPDAPDNLIRDVVAKHTYGGTIEITNNMQRMVDAVLRGPASCMTKNFNIECDDGVTRHPYEVYDPKHGWAMAVRSGSDGLVLGRCLLWHDPSDAACKIFVRSYKRERGEHAHSGADEAIESWLRSKGYQRHGEWPDGAPLAEYKVDGGWLMPYIDGGTQRVNSNYFTIDSDGDLEADQTGGTADVASDTCSCCGRRYNSEDEGIWIGVYEDEHVCGNCEDEYTYVYGRRGNQYYVTNDRAIEVGDDYYDLDYLSDNSIVELANGDFSHTDNAVYIESEDSWYDLDDSDICYDDYNDRYEMVCNCVTLRDGRMCHEDDAWKCYATDYWYSNDVDYVEVDGETYHPDDAPEAEEDIELLGTEDATINKATESN